MVWCEERDNISKVYLVNHFFFTCLSLEGKPFKLRGDISEKESDWLKIKKMGRERRHRP